MNRRSRIVGLALSAVFMAGCAGQGQPAQSVAPATQAAGATSGASAGAFDWKANSGQTITLLADQHPWTTGLEKYLDEFAALTGIEVKVQSYSEDLYYDKMDQTVRAAQGTADLYMMTMDGNGYSQYLANGVEPLTPYLSDPSKTSPDYDLSDFPENFLANGTFPAGDPSAQLYGIPISFEAYTLFYNKDLVDKYLGGKVPGTLDELVAAAQQIKAAGAADGISGSAMRAIRSNAMMDTFTGVVANDYGDGSAPLPYNLWFDGDWSKPRLTDVKVCKGLTDYAGLVKAGPANALTIDWPDATALFSQGKVAFFIDASLFGPSFEDTTQSTVAGKVGYAQIPPVDGKSTTGYWEWGLAIPKNAVNKDAAWTFIQWATGKEMTAKIGASTGGAPRVSAYSDPAYTSALKPEYVTTVSDAMKTARSTVVFNDKWKEGSLAVLDGMLAIAQGQEPTAACAAANDALLKAMGN